MLGIFLSIIALLFSGIKLSTEGAYEKVYISVISMGLILLLFLAMLYGVLNLSKRKGAFMLLLAITALSIAYFLPTIVRTILS